MADNVNNMADRLILLEARLVEQDNELLKTKEAVVSYRNRSNLLYKESTIQGEGLYNRFEDLYRFVKSVDKAPTITVQKTNENVIIDQSLNIKLEKLENIINELKTFINYKPILPKRERKIIIKNNKTINDFVRIPKDYEPVIKKSVFIPKFRRFLWKKSYSISR